jgi:hypothetical protein
MDGRIRFRFLKLISLFLGNSFTFFYIFYEKGSGG